jgi:starch-binding outer membrane protein, SusD/RagB family
MKKHIKILSLAVLAAILSVSCNDDFLDRIPLDQISNESFWETENHLMVYNNSIYHIARNERSTPILVGHDEGFESQARGYLFMDGYADNTGPRHTRQDFYARKRAGKHAIPGSPEIFGFKGWNFLRAINVGLANYGKASVSEEVRNKYIGEARLLRAWFYADKVSKFGNVQWVDRELNIDNEEILYGTRDNREFVMEKVLEDLNFATQWLPNSWGDGNAPGRLNRWAALQVKSRVCLFEGTWRKYHGGSNPEMWLQEAAAAALELMQDGPYSLYQSGDPSTSYNALHQMTDYSGNPEVLYWRRYEAGIFTNHVLNYHRDYNGGATKSMVEDYLSNDGLPITLSPLYQGDAVYENIFVNRDPRLRQTIMHPDDQSKYRFGNHDFNVYRYPRIIGMSGGQTSYTGYHIIKVWQLGPSYATYNTSTTPGIVLRLAEALLNYAEAKAELGTITQNDLDMSINLLRDRVGMPHLTLNPPMDPRYANDGVSPLIVEIRRERRVELFMEGFRYDDLRRWKQGKKLEMKDYGMRWDDANKNRFDPNGQATVQTSLVNGVPYLDVYKGTDYETPVFDENKHYLWPIPINVLSQNPSLGQNPGW